MDRYPRLHCEKPTSPRSHHLNTVFSLGEEKKKRSPRGVVGFGDGKKEKEMKENADARNQQREDGQRKYTRNDGQKGE